MAEQLEFSKPSVQVEGPWKRGKGLALGNKYSVAPTSAMAIVKLWEDGLIEVRHNADEIGQGVNTAMAQMDKVTQQNAAQAEESASASEQVMSVVNSLMQLVEDSSGSQSQSLGGRRQAQTAQRLSNDAGLMGSDRMLHQIVGGASRQTENAVAPEKLIPMDDELREDELAEQLSIRELISKPFSPRNLLETIENVLREQEVC